MWRGSAWAEDCIASRRQRRGRLRKRCERVRCTPSLVVKEIQMEARMELKKASPEGAKAIAQLHAFVRQCGLEEDLLELVKLRASQINGCAHCIDMHSKQLRADGESE